MKRFSLSAVLAVALAAAGCTAGGGGQCGLDGGCGGSGFGYGGGICSEFCRLFHPSQWRSNAIPDTYPLGSVNRAHYHTMQANAEAADFIFHRNDFVGFTGELTPAGRDRVVEIAARMQSTPFPVLIQRSEHNSNPGLDAHRMQVVVAVLTDFGVADAASRTFVSTSYGAGLHSLEAEYDYYARITSRGGGGFGGGGGGFGGGGFGGGGFGGGGFGGGGGGFGGGGFGGGGFGGGGFGGGGGKF